MSSTHSEPYPAGVNCPVATSSPPSQPVARNASPVQRCSHAFSTVRLPGPPARPDAEPRGNAETGRARHEPVGPAPRPGWRRSPAGRSPHSKMAAPQKIIRRVVHHVRPLRRGADVGDVLPDPFGVRHDMPQPVVQPGTASPAAPLAAPPARQESEPLPRRRLLVLTLELLQRRQQRVADPGELGFQDRAPARSSAVPRSGPRARRRSARATRRCRAAPSVATGGRAARVRNAARARSSMASARSAPPPNMPGVCSFPTPSWSSTRGVAGRELQGPRRRPRRPPAEGHPLPGRVYLHAVDAGQQRVRFGVPVVGLQVAGQQLQPLRRATPLGHRWARCREP